MKQYKPLWAVAHCGTTIYEQKIGGRTQMVSIPCGISGEALKLTLSNHYSPLPVAIDHVSVYNTSSSEGPVEVTFQSETTIRLQPGSHTVSDPVDFHVSLGGMLQVRVFFAEGTRALSGAGQTGAVHSEMGDHTMSAEFPMAKNDIWVQPARPFDVGEPSFILSAVEVETEEETVVVGAFGDSNTFSGAWTKPLDMMMRRSGKGLLLNLGISGNRLLKDTGKLIPMELFGFAGVKRFSWDVEALDGLDVLIVAIGGNDIFQPGTESNPDEVVPSKEELIQGYRKIASAAKAKGIRVLGATMTSAAGTPIWSEDRQQLLDEVNQWIRENSVREGSFDTVLDYEMILCDPMSRGLKKDYDSGDHVHINLQGGMAMASNVLVNL